MIKKMLLSLFVCLLLIMNVNAIEMQEIVEYQKESLELDKLERAAKPYLGSLDLDDVKFEEGLETILNTGLSELNKIWKSSLRGGILILSIVFFVLFIIGIINASNGRAKELPLIGKFKILK